MDEALFYQELDDLVNQGVTTHPEHDLDLGVFQFVRKAKSKLKRANTFMIVFLILFLLLAGGIIFLYASPGHLSTVGFKVPHENNLAMVDTATWNQRVTRLKLENENLKSQVETLEIKVRDMETSDSYPKESRQKRNEVGSDGIIRHVVARGETLYSLAVRYYGTGRMVAEMAQDNNLPDPNELPEGKTLKIYPEKRI